jgi:hypothetical protein
METRMTLVNKSKTFSEYSTSAIGCQQKLIDQLIDHFNRPLIFVSFPESDGASPILACTPGTALFLDLNLTLSLTLRIRHLTAARNPTVPLQSAVCSQRFPTNAATIDLESREGINS